MISSAPERQVFVPGVLVGSAQIARRLSRAARAAWRFRELRRLRRPEQSIEAIVDAVFTFSGGFFVPLQIKSEVVSFLRMVEEARPQAVIEIGTAHGGTLFLLSRVAAPDATIISVDLPGGPWGGGYSHGRVPFYRAFRRASQKLHFVRADSHQIGSLERVRELLPDGQCDLCLIDGDHSYQGAKQDFAMYGGLVRSAGLVAFHDIVKHASHYGVGVDRLWAELKLAHRHVELVEDWGQGSCGIGVVIRD
jgi:predicted O-methyltransferase YrrM